MVTEQTATVTRLQYSPEHYEVGNLGYLVHSGRNSASSIPLLLRVARCPKNGGLKYQKMLRFWQRVLQYFAVLLVYSWKNPQLIAGVPAEDPRRSIKGITSSVNKKTVLMQTAALMEPLNRMVTVTGIKMEK